MKMALYWILLLGQTIGDAKILSHVIPLFRRLVNSGLDAKPPSKILVSTLLGVTIIQVCYWLGQHWFATLRLRHISLFGHLILFISRLNFIFAGAVFSAVYLVRLYQVPISPLGFVWLPPCCFRYSATLLNLSGSAERYSSAMTVPNRRTALACLFDTGLEIPKDFYRAADPPFGI